MKLAEMMLELLETVRRDILLRFGVSGLLKRLHVWGSDTVLVLLLNGLRGKFVDQHNPGTLIIFSLPSLPALDNNLTLLYAFLRTSKTSHRVF